MLKQELNDIKNTEIDEIPPKKPFKTLVREKVLKHWQVFIKTIELGLCVVCLALVYEPAKSQVCMGQFFLHYIGIMYTTFAGYILINLVIIISLLSKEETSPRLAILFSLLGFALFLITGILLSVNRSVVERYIFTPNVYKITLLTWCIVATFLGAIVFAIDTAFSIANVIKLK